MAVVATRRKTLRRRVADIMGAPVTRMRNLYTGVAGWFRDHPTASVALAVLGVIVILLGPVLWGVGGWALIGDTTRRALAAFHKLGEEGRPAETVEAYGKLISAMGLLAAAPVGLLGVGLAFWRTWNQHRDGVLAARKLDAESFAKAVEQLGSEEVSVRLGAALALEALGKASPRLLSQTIEILCAYIREKRPRPDGEREEGEREEEGTVPPRLPTDIQLIVEIISRLNACDRLNRITVDLRNTNLSGANLILADLTGADLCGADLIGAKLIGANLRGADLNGASLSKANLSRANLSMADLSMANLSRANLSMADLSMANLIGADLSGAKLIEAYLIGADLSWAKLFGADLRGADLSGADLSRADLRRAKIDETDLTGANLSGAIGLDRDGQTAAPAPEPSETVS